MESTLKEAFIILDKITEKINSQKWDCMFKKCNKHSINSHLLQKKNILDILAEKNYVIEFSPNKTFEMYKDGQFSFKLKPVNKAITLPLFCNYHDSTIFKPIESGNINFSDYNSSLLFSYRALCAELRRKEIVFLENEKVLNSQNLKLYFKKSYFRFVKAYQKGIRLGIIDLYFFKNEFESNLNDLNLKLFEFKIYKYQSLNVCTSSVFSVTKQNWVKQIFHLKQKKAWNNVFVNLIPQKDALYIIIGYHKEYTSKWIKEYISSWDTKDKIKQEKNVSNLFATRINTCVISKSTFKSISENKKALFINYWKENFQYHFDDLFWAENLFE